MKKGLLIAFEGIDCCGKATQLRLIGRWLAPQRAVDRSSEPTDDWSPIGRLIRLILQKKMPFPGNFELQRLFIIDRAQHLFSRILPGVEVGEIHLLERYAFSTIAYGMLDGEAEKYICLHHEIIGPRMYWPDLTIVLDISAEEAVRRQSSRLGRPPAELFEKREPLNRIRANYLTLAERDDLAPIVVVNGEQSETEVSAEIQRVITERFPEILKPSIQTKEVSDASR